MKALERQALLADREAVQTLLSELSETDPLGQISFRARLAEIESRLKELEATSESLGTFALLFGGAPVLGSHSIEADFASRALRGFQDLVAKRVALEESGSLGSRGPLPQRNVVDFSITDLLRGSVGFALEENSINREIAPTVVKKAISEVTSVIASSASERSDEFEGTLESLDNRLLISLRDFLRTLDDKRATLRIVEDEHDVSLDVQAIHRARERIDRISIEETESDTIVGELLGLLPGSKRFEMRLAGGDIIKGSVAADLAPSYLHMIETPGQVPVGKVWRTKMRIREIKDRNQPPRRLYTLIGLLESLGDESGE